MRETLKSLIVFSASLLLIFIISSGCMVNIPGCGSRSLPFFKSNSNALRTATTGQVPPANASTPDTLQNQNIPANNTASVPVSTVDAERIAYTAMDGDQWALFTMATNGSDIQRLTPKSTNAWFPVWSPNGKELAFLSDMNDGKVNLFACEKGSQDFKQLTFFDDMDAPNTDATQAPFTWSPRSDKIALIYNKQVMLVELEKISQISLATVDPSYQIVSIDWAPRRDNRYVAFMVRQGERYHGLFLVNPRLHDQIQLSSIHETAGPICWSSDSNSVAFFKGNNLSEVAYETQRIQNILQEAAPAFGSVLSYAPVDGNTSILLLAKKDANATGFCVALVDKASAGDSDPGTLKYLTEPGVEDAIWSPDATKILYVLDGAIWVMDASGANKKRISLAGAKTPAWAKK